MFVVGATYEVTTCELIEDGIASTTHYDCRVVEVNGTVVAFEREGEPWILNTASPLFFAAELQAVH
jgi:hypothetical protein